MGLGQRLESLAEVLLSNQGSIVLGIAALLAMAAPFADRYLIRRKRVYYRVQYNSKLGLSPVDLNDHDDSVKHADTELEPLAQLLDRMSIVVIRVRNSGIDDIAKEDFADSPLEFTFGGRTIWNARISEPSHEPHRKRLTEGLDFFATTRSNGDESAHNSLSTVRRTLGQKLLIRLGRASNQQEEPPPPPPQWDGVRLLDLTLLRKEKFKLVVVLREPEGEPAGELTKTIECSGQPSGGRVLNEREQRKAWWPRVTATLGVLLTGALIVTLIADGTRTEAEGGVACADGPLRIVGSSAFAPIAENIAEEYTRSCGGAEVSTVPTGSLDGVRMLAGDDSGELAALSDGETGEATDELVPNPLAVIVYSVVVNDSVGVERLTAEQLAGIHSGRYRDWSEVRPGPSLPIRIVGRGQESGSRQTFERTVLGAPEGALTSDSCERADRGTSSPTIRCERGTEAEVVEEVATTAGAIGYVDLPSANDATADGDPITLVELGEHYPDPSAISQGYPFWTIEYVYTRGVPAEDSVLRSFLEYLRSPAARAELRDAGYTPCVGKDGGLHELCR
ncbi:PstS family phosphate ABC transporter substrate-binding protein [Prauserella cavernicola]|uniref:Substrate-binding domain-containing protein n=1 Tax=Prauserella cavernicola TaxID=2800127 RepID=A0A934QRF7_9PSEU|nr:substrate-binding domain-containing protein [Prauserella cavernicola]MBK1785331.1 substrate-binding domain-containing protein [Prauserella cavernicola]